MMAHRLRVASYNIRKAVGLDRRRSPERIIAVLREIDADIVALQEVDRRFGERVSALPRQMIAELTDYQVAEVAGRPHSMGWHGNALLVRRGIPILSAGRIPLPVIEPRGAVQADVLIAGQRLRIVGMHLDISGLRRRHQARAIIAHSRTGPPVDAMLLMGDMNQWSARGGALREFGAGMAVLAPGASFHSRRPVAELDRIILSPTLSVIDCGVHHSALAARASDHLPVWATIALPPAVATG